MTIRVRSDGRVTPIEALEGETVLAAMQRNGWHLPAPCGGVGKCGKCLVTVEPSEAAGPRGPQEERYTGTDPVRRLACRVVPVAPLTIESEGTLVPPVANDTLAKGGQILVPAGGVPVVLAETVAIDPAGLHDQRSVLRRVRSALGEPHLAVSVPLLDETARLLPRNGDMISVLVEAGEPPRMLSVSPAPLPGPFGLAFDVGTTTVAGYLVNLGDHTVVASRSEPNAQGSYGADVITRIKSHGDGAPLTEVIRSQLARVTHDLAADAGIEPVEISTAAIVGNTTMVHLLLGLDPASIARAPFLPVLTEAYSVDAAEVGLPVRRHATVRVPPGVSSYVGADITADLVFCLMHHSSGHSLLVDIGTNGEIVLGGAEGLLACSTAAGPAFEGATIRHGSGGVKGAIDHVSRDGRGFPLTTIGGVAAKSICGTGLMDAVAMLLEDGVIDDTGRMDVDAIPADLRSAYAQRMIETDGEPAFLLVGTPERPQIVLTQGDVRSVQLAKGAIAAGIRVLLQEAGIGPAELDRVYLAGGFGTYVEPVSAVRVGLLPGIDPARITALGNAAGAGAARMLVDRGAAEDAERIVAGCRYIELSGSAAFQEFYMDEMMFASPDPQAVTGR